MKKPKSLNVVVRRPAGADEKMSSKLQIREILIIVKRIVQLLEQQK